jgi:hypothetical protein
MRLLPTLETAFGGIVVVVRAEELTHLFLAERSELLLIEPGQAQGLERVSRQALLALQPGAERLEAAGVLVAGIDREGFLSGPSGKNGVQYRR